jgi:hypothetical protein
MKISNFKIIKETGAYSSKMYYAEVDVTTTKGFWLWKKCCTERRIVCSHYGGAWFFIDTGEFTPGFEVDTLYRAERTRQSLHRLHETKQELGKKWQHYIKLIIIIHTCYGQ